VTQPLHAQDLSFQGAEIDEKMPKGKPLDTKALGASQMPYLNGVFYELWR